MINPLKRLRIQDRNIAVELIFLLSTISGVAGVLLIALTLLLIALDKIDV